MAKIIQIKDGSTDVLPVGGESGSGYCKMPDGTMIAWQEASFANGDYAKSCYWAGRFASIESVMLSTDAADVTTFGTITSNNQTGLGRRPHTTACKVRILAIGRWK